MQDSKTERFVKDGAVISGTAALLSVVGEMVMRRTNLGFAARGGAQAAAFVLVALISASYAPRFAMGALTAGVVQGVRGLSQEYELRQLLAQTGTATAALGNASTGGAAAGGAGAINQVTNPLRAGGALGQLPPGAQRSLGGLYAEALAHPQRR